MPRANRKSPAVTSKSPEPDIPALLTVTGMAGILGLPMATLRDALNGAGLPVVGFNSSRDGFRAVVKDLREKSSRKDAGASARQRKADADADTAEIGNMTAKGELVSRASALAWFADGITEFRRTIERSTDLTPTQKTRLLAACAKVKPKSMDL